MEESFKLSIEHQKRLNPAMKEVVRAEVIKFMLGSSVLYQIVLELVQCKWYQRREV